MKQTAIKIATIAVVSAFPLMAETTETTETTDVTKTPRGTVTRTQTTTTFNPEARTKIVKYFDTYKTEKHGLPPGWAAKMKFKEVPTAWRMSVSPGLVIAEKERDLLVAAPPELVEVLPPATEGVRYYIAGSNVIAVDSEYRVIDSVQIPSIKISVD